MASTTLPVLGQNGTTSISATDAVQADSVSRRDSNGDNYSNVYYAAKGLRTAGHLYLDQQAKSANFTVDESSNNGTIYNVTTSSSTITVTLPTAVNYADKTLCIKKVDTGTGTVVIDGDGSETIEGKTTFTLYTAGDVVWITSDGSNWRVVDINLSPVVISKTSSFTADDQPLTHFVYICDTTSGSVTATLPASASLKGREFTFKKTVAANNLVLDGNSSETIDGATTKTSATQYASYRIICDASNWHNVATAGTWT